MTEKVNIKGKEIWIIVESHLLNLSTGEAKEYFTASYTSTDPAGDSPVNLFTCTDKKPVSFDSPVEALEYANEKLLGLI